MSMIAFFPTYDTPAPAAVPEQGAVRQHTVEEKVTVQQVPARTDMLKAEENWTWQELRDYVCSQIIALHGPFPRNAKKEYGIFNRFLNEHGTNGILVAKAAFEIYNGWWRGAPISINRFARGSDPYFVEPILGALAESGHIVV